MWLGDRRRDVKRELEDLLHFVLDCGKLEEERREAFELQRPKVEQRQTVVGEFLFGEEESGRKSKIFMKMWRKRRQIEQRGEE